MKKFLQQRKRFFYLVAPAVIGAIYLILCVLNINQSIGVIESQNLYLTRFDFGQIWNYSFSEAQPPLFLFVLKIWAHFFGHSVVTMRLLSALFGALTIVFVYLWLKYKYGVSAAIISTFLLSISPIFVHFGQEMQAFTMIFALTFAASFFLQLAIDNHRKIWWFIYVFLFALGLWTHRSMVLIGLAHLVYLGFVYHKKVFQKTIILSYAISLVLALPPLWTLIQHGVESGGEFNIIRFADFWTQALFYESTDHISNWLLILALAATMIVILLIIHYRKKLHLLTSLIAIPPIVLMCFSVLPARSFFKITCLSCSAIAISILIGVAFTMSVRTLLGRKTKKVCFFKKPYWSLGLMSIVLGAMFIYGLSSVFAKGNLDFATNIRPTTQSLYSDIIVIDGGENISIIAETADIYLGLSAYETKQHDIHFTTKITPLAINSGSPLKETHYGHIGDLNKFLASRNEIMFVGICPEKGYMTFPSSKWRVTSFANVQYDDQGECFQILKLEKE